MNKEQTPVSYDFALSLAYLANDARTAQLEAGQFMAAAETLDTAAIPGAVLEVGAKAVLASQLSIVTSDFEHANKSVPSFYNEVVSVSNSPETLTSAEAAYKAAAFERFATDRRIYISVMDRIKGEWFNPHRLKVATVGETLAALEATLTPAIIRAEMAQIAEFTANPERYSPEPGFDTVFRPNAYLVSQEEDNVANFVQRRLQNSTNREQILDIELHSTSTAHFADCTDLPVVAMRVPRHLNVRLGDVATQAAQIDAHNRDPNNKYTLEMADDLIAMIHIASLIINTKINTRLRFDTARYWATYHRNVLASHQHGYVPSVYVNESGQLFRGSSPFSFPTPTRALMMPKA